MKYPDVVTERMEREREKTWLRQGEERKIRKVRLNYLQSNMWSRGQSRQDGCTSLQFFENVARGVHKEHRRSINKAVKQRSACGCVRRLGGRSRCGPVLQLRCARRRLRSSQLRRSSLRPPSRHVLDIVVVYTVLSSTPWDIHK